MQQIRYPITNEWNQNHIDPKTPGCSDEWNGQSRRGSTGLVTLFGIHHLAVVHRNIKGLKKVEVPPYNLATWRSGKSPITMVVKVVSLHVFVHVSISEIVKVSYIIGRRSRPYYSAYMRDLTRWLF